MALVRERESEKEREIGEREREREGRERELTGWVSVREELHVVGAAEGVQRGRHDAAGGEVDLRDGGLDARPRVQLAQAAAAHVRHAQLVHAPYGHTYIQ